MRLLKKIFGLKKNSDFINDRRYSKRYDMVLKLNYTYPEEKYSEESFTKNISKYGIRFPVKSKLLKGSILDIKIESIVNSNPLSLKGKVVWLEEFLEESDSETTKYEAGVNFLEKKLF